MGTAILYKANETQFNHLGLGPLNDAVSILVTEERNGIFELEMKYPVSGKVFHELKNDRIIKADAGHKLKDQRFKIIRITKPLKGVVTVYAEHVSYLTQDLALKPKVTFSGNARQALEHWKANLVDDNPFTVWSDISTTGKINWTIDEVENARRALGGVQGSILDVYGGEYLFDNYDIYLYQKRGVNSELLIAYGRNLVDLEQEEEIANTYTSIYPYSIYTDDDGNERMVTLPEFYVDSEHVDKYARRKILVVDFTTEEIKTVSALRSAARRYIKDNDVGVPKVNLKIQYVDLAKTLDYKHQALLEEVNLCDNVMIYFEKYDINTTAKVIKVVWDVLNERYDSIEVGEARASLSQAIDTVVDGKVHNVEKLAMQTLRTADGKNTIYFGLEEPTGDQLKKNDIWYRIVDGEFTRTYRYDGVTWQLIIDMDSQEAKQEAQQAKDRAEEAVERANQATQQANESIKQAQSAFDKALESLDETAEIRTELGELSYTVTDNSTRINTLTITTDRLSGRLEKLDIRGYNFITHLPKLWEHGFYGITGVDDMEAGAKYDSDQLIRLSDKYRLEPNTDYVLSDHPELAREGHEYIETNLFLHLWNDDGSYSRYLVLNFRNEEHFITFKTSSTETHFSLHVMPTSPDVYLKPDDVHNVFFYKLALGTEKSGWTPNLDDTSELVSDVQNFVHDFSITAESLASRITDNEGRITTISSTVQGLQTTVSDVQGNVSNLTQLSNTMQAQLKDVEGNVNTLTLTSQSMQSTISSLQEELEGLEYENRNLYIESTEVIGVVSPEDGSVDNKPLFYRTSDYIKVEPSAYYTFNKYITKEPHRIAFYDQNKNFIKRLTPSDETITHRMSDETHYIRYTRKSIGEGAFMPKIEKGNRATDWSPAPEDLATQSQITQLSDAINMRVTKGDVINQINLDTSGVLISGKKLILDGDTTVKGTFKVSNANITSLDAGKITTGTLDAGKISVINLSANSIVGGILSSQNSNTTFNLNNGNLSMRQANFSLGGGANIEFLDRANKITYRFSSDRTRVAGLGVGVALGNEYPFAYLGTTGASELDTLSPYFSGFVANTTARIARDNSANSVYGKRFRFISDTDYNEGITIDFFNNYTTIESFGKYLNFGNLNHLYGLQGLTIRNYHNKTSGWLVETNYAGDGRAITLRGLNAGTYNYQIGSKSSRILNIYLRYNPDVLSDERLKTDISDIDLGLNFIKRIKAKQFKLKLTDADIIQGAQNKLQYGVIAQQVKSVLADFGVSDNSLITESEDGYYGAQYGQFIAPLIKSVQELDTKLTDNVELLKLKVQYLEQKIEQLEAS